MIFKKIHWVILAVSITLVFRPSFNSTGKPGKYFSPAPEATLVQSNTLKILSTTQFERSEIATPPRKNLGDNRALLSMPVRNQIEIEDFDLLNQGTGWLLMNQTLFWTLDRGRTWSDITPPLAAEERISAVFFLVSGDGWVFMSGVNQIGEPSFRLAKTSNEGKSWRISELRLFSSGEVDAYLQSAYLTFIDAATGWLVVRQASSSNFNYGVLFRTDDGGLTWQRYEIPFGEPVYFMTKNSGWVSGGPTGEGFYRSIDGGRSWQEQFLQPLTHGNGYPTQLQNPQFSTPELGFLPVIFNDESSSHIQVYISEDAGRSWYPSDSTAKVQRLDASNHLAFSLLGDSRAVVIHPDTGQIFSASKVGMNSNSILREPLPPSIIKLDMSSNGMGWIERSHGECGIDIIPESVSGMLAGGKVCQNEDQLFYTQDGGLSWNILELPEAAENGTSSLGSTLEYARGEETSLMVTSTATAKRTRIVLSQGFDKCEIPTLDKLQEWIRYSPYDAVNLYIGGAARSCSNLALNASYISQLSQQGWNFIPTWVGPQAACYPRNTARMSSDAVIARQEGMAEANAAIEKASELGLTLADKSGALIYYDLERYDMTNTLCHQAARAFIEGWSSQMRSRNNTPGLYSSGPILNDYFTLTQKPDVIWPAHWIASNYSDTATVWNVYQLSNNYWMDRERLRQYAGGHSETWGTVSITVDSNVMDGLAALGPLEEDENNDGNAEIYIVRKMGGQSGFTEIYTLNGKTFYSAIQSHFQSILPFTNDQWAFDLADYDNDAIPDLFAFNLYATPSGRTDLQVLSGASGYKNQLLTLSTSLNTSLPGSWVYLMGNYDQDGIPDLYAIQRNAQSGVQVTILSGSSGYQTLVANFPTALGNLGTSGGWYLALGDYNQDHFSDLSAINKNPTTGANTHITILNGADYFLTTILNSPTALAKTGTDNGWVFFLRDHNNDGIPDLFAMNKATGSQGLTELTILDGRTQYLSIIANITTGLPNTGSDCNWDFLTGQCYTSNPGVLFRIFLPLTYKRN